MRYTTRIIVPPKTRRAGAPGAKDARYAPQVIGVRKSFGFGDVLGCATAGILRAASAHREWMPFLAQQSPDELAATRRTPDDLLRATSGAVEKAVFRSPWGADADRLRTPGEVELAALAGFTYFTIDPSEYLRHEAAGMSVHALEAELASMIREGEMPENWADPYLGKYIDLPGDYRLELTREPLLVRR